MCGGRRGWDSSGKRLGHCRWQMSRLEGDASTLGNEERRLHLAGRYTNRLLFPISLPPSVPPTKPTPSRTSDNPFTYGNPVSEPKQFFGRVREIRNVVNRLRGPAFGSSSLVGERRVGKTSLLKHLLHPTLRQEQGLGTDKYLFVYMDLQESNESTTPVRFWQLLLERMALASFE